MKNFKFTPTSVILLVTLLLSNSLFSQNTVTPTSGAEWLGYVNAFSISDGEFQFGEVYQVESMKSTITSTSIELQPNFAIWESESNNPAWFDDTSSTQTPLVYIDGSTYAENNNLAGADLTFMGNVSEADLDAGYTAVAFIKALDAENNYATVVNNYVDITSAGDFTVSATAA